MAPIVPYIPETITVHLGAPDAGAENVTVSFSDYVKNVLSSEVYPTWEPAALRANALAVISFALNRVYTEYYRSRGYPFDITSSTAIDQKFINGRNIYENISALVDELFTDYLRRQGYVEPLAAKFCNGVTTTCDGLSQWGSQELAQAGADSVRILRRYYGEDVQIVTNAPVQDLQESYPGSPVRRGDIGVNVSFLQVALAELSGHPEGPGRRHPRRGNGECRPGLPVHFLAGRRRDRGPGDLVRDRDALYGSFEARGAAVAGADVLRLFVGVSRTDPSRRAGREGDASGKE